MKTPTTIFTLALGGTSLPSPINELNGPVPMPIGLQDWLCMRSEGGLKANLPIGLGPCNRGELLLARIVRCGPVARAG